LCGFDCGLGGGRNRQVVEGNVVELGEGSGFFVVGEDEREVAVELAGAMAVEEVDETVGILRDEEGDVLDFVRELDAPVHAELGGDGREGGAEGGFVEVGGVGGELDAHEEESEFDVLVLVGVEDVDVVGVDEEIDDGDDDALAVGAVDEQDGGLRGGHRS
jgi:hypothetical protein